MNDDKWHGTHDLLEFNVYHQNCIYDIFNLDLYEVCVTVELIVN